MSDFAILTPTGGRPEAFAACVSMMQKQTIAGPVYWIIVDDGPEPMETPKVHGWNVHHIRPTPAWQPGQNTLARNLLEGLCHVWPDDKLAIVEDDDEYAPWWLERCDEWLSHVDLVGESHSLYCHKNGKQFECNNERHASLCSTALKGEAIRQLADICTEGALGIDIRLWKRFEGSKRLYRPEPRGVTGIKGWPGRPGIGMGHRI